MTVEQIFFIFTAVFNFFLFVVWSPTSFVNGICKGILFVIAFTSMFFFLESNGWVINLGSLE